MSGLVHLCFAVTAAVLPAAGAGIAAPPDAGDPAGVRADVYIDDSLEARDKIDHAKRLARRGQWLDAAALLHEAAETAGDKLIEVAPLSYVGLTEYINGIIADWPADGIAAYRQIVEPDIAVALADETDESLARLVALFDRYFCTETAADLADRIGQQAVEAGELALAERLYRRVLDRHPDAARFADRYRAMVFVLQAIRGEAPILSPADRELPIQWKGEDRTLGSVLPEVTAMFALAASTAPDTDWPMFGGNPARDGSIASTVDELGLLWRYDGFLSAEEEANEGSETLTAQRWRETAKQLSLHAMLSDDLVFVQRYREIVALRRNTGARAWRYTPPAETGLQPSELSDLPPGCDAVTISGGRVYAALGGEVVPYYGYESAQHPPELVCLDARTGRLIWRIGQDGSDFTEVSFDTAPLVQGDAMYIVGRRRRSFGFEDCYLYRFSAADGTQQARTHLGSASTGTYGARRATLAIPAMHGDTIFVCTNIGSIAAVSAQTGSVRWLRVYEREQEGETGDGAWTMREVKPWAFNPVIYREGRLYCLPIDAPCLLVLAGEDGRLIQTVPKTDLANIVSMYGVRDGLLCGFGDKAFCYNLESGAMRWTSDLAPTAQALGRGAWSGDRILVPTTEGLSSFALLDGGRTNAAWDTDGVPGNVLPLREHLLIAGDGAVSAYVRKAEIWRSLRARMAAAPTDPLPALELAEVALQGGELPEAMEALDEAVRRAGGLLDPPPPAVRRRFYDDIRTFVDVHDKRAALNAQVLKKLVVIASQCAPDEEASLQYRLRFGDLFDHYERPADALRLYQQVLRDRSLRELSFANDTEASQTGGAVVQRRIAALLERRGKEIYEPYEAEARGLLDTGRAAKDERLIERVAEVFPNSDAASAALLELGELYLAKGEPETAAATFTRAYYRHGNPLDRPSIVKMIASAYAQANRPEHAFRWLTKAARELPGATVEYEGRRMSFLAFRDALLGGRDRLEPQRPRVTLPLDGSFSKALDPAGRLLVPQFRESPQANWSRYFVAGPDGVRALAAGGTEEAWPAPLKFPAPPRLLFAGNRIVLLATAFEVAAVEAETGAPIWSHADYPDDFDPTQDDWEDGRSFRAHALGGDRLVSVREDGRMTCVSVTSGQVLWSRGVNPLPLGPLRVADAWVVYTVLEEGSHSVVLLDAGTGTQHARVVSVESRPVEGFFVTLDGQLVIVTTRSLTSYDIDASTMRWRVSLDGHLRSGTLSAGLDAVYFSDDGRRVRKIGLDDGQTAWETDDLVRRGEDDLSVNRLGGFLFLSTAESISAVDDVSGLTLWRGTTPNLVRFLSRFVTTSYVVAIDVSDAHRDEPSRAFFYDHRQGSGVIPKNGGALELGKLEDIRAVLVLDDTILVQTGNIIRGWTRKK